MDLNQSIEQLKQELSELGEGGKWFIRGRFLYQAKRQHKWDLRGSNTFGQFVSRLGEEVNAKSALLWRELKAYDFFISLKSKRPDLPDESALISRQGFGLSIGAGHLDVLQRIEPVMPEAEFNDVVTRLFSSDPAGGYTRRQLDEIWEIRKKALEGSTPRGRNQKQEINREVLGERMLLEKLATNGARWLKDWNRMEIYAYELLLDPPKVRIGHRRQHDGRSGDALFRERPGLRDRNEADEIEFSGEFDCDAIAVTAASPLAPARFHGIELCLKPGKNFEGIRADKAVIRAFDYFWILTPGGRHIEDLRHNDHGAEIAEAGILEINETGIWLVRPPYPIGHDLEMKDPRLLSRGYGTCELAKRLYASKMKKSDQF